MIIEIKLPQLSEEYNESLIAFWHVSEGDAVEQNDILVEVQTEKAVSELHAPASGIVKEIRKKEEIQHLSAKCLQQLKQLNATGSLTSNKKKRMKD